MSVPHASGTTRLSLKRKRKSVSEFQNENSCPPGRAGKKFKVDPLQSRPPTDGASPNERVPLGELSRMRITNENLSSTGKSNKNIRHHCDQSVETESPSRKNCSGSETESFAINSTLQELRDFPKLKLSWVKEEILWKYLKHKDSESSKCRGANVFDRHPNLQPKMRSILLEWLIEVCDVYSMHRETFYKAVEYLDRYLNLTQGILKARLQLIGISCLFLASKVEEIYPPKVSEFAYVTDGACNEDDIRETELEIIRTLDWNCSVVTSNSWLCIYLQLLYRERNDTGWGILYPQYPNSLFSDIARLLDLVTLDVACLRFPNSILAVSCLYVAGSKSHALSVSGYQLSEVLECVDWVECFWEVLNDRECETSFDSLPPPEKKPMLDFSHALQKHTVNLELFEKAQERIDNKARLSSLDLLTPPPTSKRGKSTSLCWTPSQQSVEEIVPVLGEDENR